MFDIRVMTQADIPGVLTIQLECYDSATVEDEKTIRARLNISPDSAWVAEDEGGVCAYLVAYRSVLGKITPLGGIFDLQSQCNSLYLHDLAIANRSKGLGVGSALVEFALTQASAEGLGYLSLVSVQSSSGFWQRLGFSSHEQLKLEQRNNLATYNGPALYMVRPLRPQITSV